MSAYPRRASSDSRIMDTLRHMTVNPYGRVFEAGRSRMSPTSQGVAGDKLISEFQTEIEAKNMEIDNLRREMRQKEETTQHRMDLAIAQHEAQSQAAVMEAEEETEKLRRFVSRLESQKRDAEREARQQIRDLEEEVQRLSDKAAKADQMRAELAQRPGADRRLRRLSDQLERLEPVKEELEKENERLRAQLLAIPLLEEQLRLFQEKATAAEFAVGELQLAAAMQHDEAAQLRLQLQNNSDALGDMALERRRPTPTGQPVAICNLDELLMSPMASPSGSFAAEPSLGDQMSFLELSNESNAFDASPNRSGSPDDDGSDAVQQLHLELAEKNEQLDEKQRIIDHLEQAQSSVVAASHRMQREVSQLKQEVSRLQQEAESRAGGPAPAPAAAPAPVVPAVLAQRSDSPLAVTFHAISVELAKAAREAAKEEGSIVTYPSLRGAVVTHLGRELEAVEKVYVRGFAEAAAAHDSRELVRLVRANAALRADLDEARAQLGAAGATLGSAPVLVDGHLFVPDGASVDGYQGNAAVRRVTMGCDVTVSPYSFLGCPALESVVAGGGCTLGADNFADCKKLTSVTAGERFTASDGAFQGCELLQSVSLGPAAQLGRGLPERFYLAAGGKVTTDATAATPTPLRNGAGGAAMAGDTAALAAQVASLTREVDFLTQGIRVKDQMLAEIQRDARAALMPALGRELELAKLMSARLRWQIALLTSRCKSLKGTAAKHESKSAALAKDNAELQSELATALKVIQSCPVAKILEKQRERKRRKKEKEKRLRRRAAGRKTPRHSRGGPAAAAKSSRKGVRVTGATLDGASAGGAPAACACGEAHNPASHPTQHEDDEDESTESKTAKEDTTKTTAIATATASTTGSATTQGSSSDDTGSANTTPLSSLSVQEAAKRARRERELLEQSTRELDNAERVERALKRDRFVAHMCATTDKLDFKEHFDAAFDCVDKVRMRGKSSYGYEYSYEGEVNDAGKPHGIGRAQFDKRKHGVYIGEFVDGLFHGRGTRAQPQGCYTGSWQRGKLHGQGTLWKADGTEGFSGQWENSKPVLATAVRPSA